MARAQYDRNEVVDKAIDLFWEHGYSGSSMSLVTKATGLKPGSIYYSFGNKDAMFKLALERYTAKSLERLTALLDEAPTPEHGICAHLDNFARDAATSDFRSCFLLKTQLELAAEGGELHSCAVDGLGKVESLFREYLSRTQGEELARERATSIMLHIFGMRVYGYRRPSAEKLQKALRQGLPWLPWTELEPV